MRLVCCLLLFMMCPSAVNSQEEEPSLAETARKNREGKPKSKIVINEDTFTSVRGPLPNLNTEGVDNSDDVVKAIQEFQRGHSKQETERVVHEWYDHYDLMLERAISENHDIANRAQDRYIQPRQYPDDYKKYEEARALEARAALQEQRTIQKNSLLTARIQQGFQKVRNSLQGMGIRYEWMKIRFGNGNGSW